MNLAFLNEFTFVGNVMSARVRVIIYCPACASLKQAEILMGQKMQREARKQALSRNPFLPYYDKNFKKRGR